MNTDYVIFFVAALLVVIGERAAELIRQTYRI